MKTLSATAFTLTLAAFLASAVSAGELKVGTAVTDVTPVEFPVLVNGGMLSRSTDKVKTPVNARSLVLDDGRERLAVVVVDSCMMPRPLLDEAKQLASTRTRIRPDRMLISATHTHSAPASMGCLGTDADPAYVPFLVQKLAESIAAAESKLEPAEYGWAVADAADYTALRRWIRRPDRIAEDPFGNLTVRANMHAGRVWDDVTGESGPEDPELSMIAFRTRDGRPLAVLANFSMHYFGDEALSADYFGLFCEGLKQEIIGDGADKSPFVGIMSHGCSGDIWRRDYTKPSPAASEDHTIASYAAGLVDIAARAYKTIEYRYEADLAMAEWRQTLPYRVPDKQRFEWARRIVDAMGDRLPKDTTEVYAREQIILHERQATEIVVQALRVGDVAIATTPCETYALTGIKLKLQSPLEKTMVIELANGGDGYIPPPEQHVLGGYNTWAARSAGLEVMAEPKIVEAALQLLEQVTGRPRRQFKQTRGPAAEAIAKLKPVAWWRLDELAGPRAVDSSNRQRDAIYETGVVFFLEGPRSTDFSADEINRAAHFAGGRLDARLESIGEQYSVSLWFWSGLPPAARETAGWLVSRGPNHGLAATSEHLGLGGSAHTGKLIFQRGSQAAVAGSNSVERWTWNHVALVRDGRSVRVYLNGKSTPEIECSVESQSAPFWEQFFIGGRSDNQSNWEGRLDEIAVFDRPLSAAEIGTLAGSH